MITEGVGAFHSRRAIELSEEAEAPARSATKRKKSANASAEGRRVTRTRTRGLRDGGGGYDLSLEELEDPEDDVTITQASKRQKVG